MQYLDQQVIQQALSWLEAGRPVWLCTVLSTFGSAPREPGSMMAASLCPDSGGGESQVPESIGTLSGGCVEDDFLERLQLGDFQRPAEILRYGAASGSSVAGSSVTGSDGIRHNPTRIRLPCGGTLDVLIEQWQPDDAGLTHASAVLNALTGRELAVREVRLSDGHRQLSPAYSTSGACRTAPADRVSYDARTVQVTIGPAHRLIIAGLSTVAVACAEFAVSLGYEVIVCEPREEEYRDFHMSGVRLETCMPSSFIAREGQCHAATAVVAMTHDPRIDDLAMMAAVKTPAFYIGVMGSRKTSDARSARLMRSGGLSVTDVERLHMPIGLALGSKTPAEIALAVMADVMRVQKGRDRHDL